MNQAPYSIERRHRYLDTANNRKALCTILFILWVGLFFLFHWNSFNTPFERDEGEYAYSAWLLDQDILPYENSFLQKPPMIIYTYWVAYKINPHAYWPPRLLGAIFTALTILLIALIAKKGFGRDAGLVAMFLGIPMLSLPKLTPFAANTEKFMLLPLIGVLAIYFFHKKSEKIWPWLFSGILSAMAVLYKPIALPPIVFIFSVWAVQTWMRIRDKGSLLRQILAAATGVISTLIITLGYFIIRDGGRSLWECVLLFNRYYLELMSRHIPSPFSLIKLFWENWWILFIFTLFFFIRRQKHWWFYGSLLAISILTVCGSIIRHYYLLIIPFWILLIPSGMQSIIELIHVKKSLRPIGMFVLTMITLSLIIWPIRNQFTLSSDEFCLWIYGRKNPFLESRIVADKVGKITSETDPIFVAGSEPQIYYYSKRLSASRFVITYPLSLKTQKVLKYQNEAIKELKNDPPEVIVYSKRWTSGLWIKESPRNFTNYIDDLITHDYELVGGYVWHWKKGEWQDSLTDDQSKRASLLVYKRKRNQG